MKYITRRTDLTIEEYIENLNSKYTYPVWQREEGWSTDYKDKLIESIVLGIDIPKFYIGKIKDTELQYIMDGGHRSRAIKQFKNNEISFVLDGTNVYYDKKFDHNTRNTTVLSKGAREHFDNFQLTIVTYINIEEKDCRRIFNLLQNARPMDIEDVINSYESEFIDFIRELINHKINSQTITEYFKEIHGLSEAKTKVMTQLISWFTIIFPNQSINEPWENALKYIIKGNKNKSPILDYIYKVDREITYDEKKEFIKHITFIFNYINECPNKKIAPTDLNTLIHSRIYINNFNINKFNDLVKNVDIYKNMKNSADKINKEKKYEESTEINKQADKINSSFNGELERWATTRRNGGNNPGGMKVRLEIVEELCCDK
mgnify:FL=1